MSSELWLGRMAKALAVVVLATVLAVLGVDLVLRWRTHLAAEQYIAELWRGGRPTMIDAGPNVQGPGIRASPLPNLVYEPRPNLRGNFDGAELATNHLGARHDFDLPRQRGDGEFRLIGIGGDTMWGRGVGNGETYLDRLQEKLGRLAPGRAHVVNLGLWGYNATQQVAALRWKGLSLQPDVVVVALDGHDLMLPTYRARLAYRPPGGSYLLAAMLGLWRGEPQPQAEPTPSYADLEEAYDELAALTVERGFSVVVFSDCLLDRPWAELPSHCQRLSAEEWQRWQHRNQTLWGFGRCPFNSELIAQQVPPWRTPSPEGHRVLAGLLYDCLMADPGTHPGLAPQAVIRLPVTNPGLWLTGFLAPDPDQAVARSRGSEALELGVRWLEPGERYFISLELSAPATPDLTLGTADGEAQPLSADSAGHVRGAKPFEVDQAGELHLRLSQGSTPSGEVSLRAVRLERAPR